MARGLNFARFGVRKGDPSGPVRRKSYDSAFRIPLCFEKRVNVGMRFEKRVHVRSDPSPTPLLFGVGGSGRRPVNPPTPERSVGAGVWGNKLLVVKKGFNKYYYKYYSRPGGAGG